MSDTTALIQVKQLPIIEERLQELKSRWEQKAADAEAMVCTEDTIQAVKLFRAEMRKEFEEIEALRKQIKKTVMTPYDEFLDVYHECVTLSFEKADEACALKISYIEDEIKQRCEDGLREYFAELCAAHGIDWLKYEDAGIKVDMASAKQKTPKKLREQSATFIANVSKDIETIAQMDDADELMAEYKRRLNLPEAFAAVQDRHRRIEAERRQMEQRAAQKAAEDEAVRHVEALAPPTVLEEQITVTFTVTDTKVRLIALREYMKANGYKYRNITFDDLKEIADGMGYELVFKNCGNG